MPLRPLHSYDEKAKEKLFKVVKQGVKAIRFQLKGFVGRVKTGPNDIETVMIAIEEIASHLLKIVSAVDLDGVATMDQRAEFDKIESVLRDFSNKCRNFTKT